MAHSFLVSSIHRRRRKKDLGALWAISSGIPFLLQIYLLVSFFGNAAYSLNFESVLKTTQNTRLQDRLVKMGVNRAQVFPVQVPRLSRDGQGEAFLKIMRGELNEVSLENIYKFLDKAKEEGENLKHMPLYSHSEGCLCLNHLDHKLLTALVHLTRHNPKYGLALLVYSGFSWTPPIRERFGVIINRDRILAFACLAIAIVLVILVVMLIYLFVKFRHMKLAAQNQSDAEATKAKMEYCDPGKFDLTRTDLLN